MTDNLDDLICGDDLPDDAGLGLIKQEPDLPEEAEPFVLRRGAAAIWWPIGNGNKRKPKTPCRIIRSADLERGWWWIKADGLEFIATAREIFPPET